MSASARSWRAISTTGSARAPAASVEVHDQPELENVGGEQRAGNVDEAELVSQGRVGLGAQGVTHADIGLVQLEAGRTPRAVDLEVEIGLVVDLGEPRRIADR